jgi:sulfofructose kinase
MTEAVQLEASSRAGAGPRRLFRRNYLAHSFEGGLYMGALSFVSASTLMPTVVRSLGVPVVGDFSRIGETTAALLKHVDYAILSEGALGDLDPGAHPRAACEKLRSMGPRCAVITRGAKGLAHDDGETYGEMPAFDVDVVDTTGAGDVLHGAFCYGLVRGFDLERNLRFASATAAVKCTRLGGRAGIPNRQEVERFLREHQGAV